jgi:predicted glutamine amidotransferase
MCELFCLSSRQPTRATFSLKAFADRGGPDGRNVDGWGIAFYDGRDARLYKEPEPARDSAWLDFIERQRIPTRLLISHIRHAIRGSITLANTQPFVREVGGRAHVFAHNGYLLGIEERLGRSNKCFQPIGETDSERAFCLLLETMARLWVESDPPSLIARLGVVSEFAAILRPLGPANFLYSDGDFLFAHGHRRTQSNGVIEPPGLWCLHRDCMVDADSLLPAGVSIVADGGAQELTLLASVPLSGESWRPLAEGEIVVVADGQVASTGLLPIALPSSRNQT